MRPFPALPRAQLSAGIEQWVARRSRARWTRQQVESLKDEADLLGCGPPPARLRQHRDVLTVKDVAAAGWLIETAKNIHEGGLAAAAGAHYRDELTASDIDRNAAQRPHLRLAQVVGFGDLLNMEERGCFRLCLRCRTRERCSGQKNLAVDA